MTDTDQPLTIKEAALRAAARALRIAASEIVANGTTSDLRRAIRSGITLDVAGVSVRVVLLAEYVADAREELGALVASRQARFDQLANVFPAIIRLGEQADPDALFALAADEDES